MGSKVQRENEYLVYILHAAGGVMVWGAIIFHEAAPGTSQPKQIMKSSTTFQCGPRACRRHLLSDVISNLFPS